jgi:hypothetical protein
MSGIGDKVVLTGGGDDEITLGNSDSDIVADNGSLDYANQIYLSDNTVSGDDTIIAGNGNHRILAGNGSDLITLGAGNNTILADTGIVDEAAQILTADGLGNGVDVIMLVDGDNRILAGDGSDTITTGAGNNDILADTGSFDYAAGLFTADENGSGDDVIVTGLGDQRILGGYGVDTITTTDGNDIILGDTGTLQFTVEPLSQSLSRAVFQRDGSLLTLAKAVAEGSNGAADIISSGDGDNVILAGGGSDSLATGNGFDIILGDNGFWDETNQRLESISDNDLGNDIIRASTGGSLIAAGLGEDEVITNGLAGIEETDIVFGDDGFIQYDGDNFVLATIASAKGGNDIIHIDGDYDIVSGGYGDDVISMADGALRKNIVIGDAAQISYADRKYTIIQQSTLVGGNDSIQGTGLFLGGDGINEYELSGGINKYELGGYSDTLLDILLSLTTDENTLTFPSGPADYIELPSLTTDRPVFLSLDETGSIASRFDGVNEPLNDVAILRKPLLDTDVRDIKAMSNEQLRDFLRSLPLPADRANLTTVKSVESVISHVSQIEEKQRDQLVQTYQRIASLINNVELDLHASDGSVSRLQVEMTNRQQDIKLAQKAYEIEPSIENKLRSTETIESYNKLANQLDLMKAELNVLLEQYKIELDNFTDDIEVSESLLLIAISRPAWQLSSLNAVDKKEAVTSTKRRFRLWER